MGAAASLGDGMGEALAQSFAEQLLAFTFVMEESLRQVFPDIYTVYDFGKVEKDNVDDNSLAENKHEVTNEPLLSTVYSKGIGNLRQPELLLPTGTEKTTYRPFSVKVEGKTLNITAGVNCVNAAGWSPLHACCHSIKTIDVALSIINEVVETNGSLNLLTKRGPGKATHGWSALHIAAAYGLEKVVRALVQNGAKVNTYSECGWNPLFECVRRGYTNIALFLIKNGAKINEIIPPGPNNPAPAHSCLAMAARNGQEDMLDMLLENGADCDLRSRLEWTALHEACHANHLPIVLSLLLNGCNPNARSKSGILPVQLCTDRRIVVAIFDARNDNADDERNRQLNQSELALEVEKAEQRRKAMEKKWSEEWENSSDSDEALGNNDWDSGDGLKCPPNANDNEEICDFLGIEKKHQMQNKNKKVKQSSKKNRIQETKSDNVMLSNAEDFRLLGNLPTLKRNTISHKSNNTSMTSHLSKNFKKKKQKKSTSKSDLKLELKRQRKNRNRRLAKGGSGNQVPFEFLCELSGKLMKTPVRTPSGRRYECKVIESWLLKSKKCPLDGLPLSRTELLPYPKLSARIKAWKIQRAMAPAPNASPVKQYLYHDNKEYAEGFEGKRSDTNFLEEHAVKLASKLEKVAIKSVQPQENDSKEELKSLSSDKMFFKYKPTSNNNNTSSMEDDLYDFN